MNRDVMGRQMFARGGQVQYMQEGGMPMAPPMAPPGGMMAPPMAPPPGGPGEMMAPPPGAPGEEFDPAALQSMLETAQTQFQGIDAAAENEDFGAMMNAIRGDEAPIEARYEELASMVGPEDAQQTPESVLTLLQPVMQMAAVDQGIGGLAQDEMMAPVEGPMAEGIMSTVNMAPPPGAPAPAPAGVDPMAMAAPGGAAPVNFRQGGAVQYFNPENEERVVQAEPNRLNELYDQNLALRQSIMGSGDQASEYEDQKRITQSQMLFDIAQGALAFATPGETQMSAAERLAQVAQPVLGNIGARTGDLQKFKQSQTKDARALKLDALGSAETMLDKEQTEAARTALAQQEIDATTARDVFAQAKDLLILSKQQSFAKGEGETDRKHGLRLADRKIAAQNALQQLQGSQQIGVETLRGQLRAELAGINNTFMENQQGREFSFKTKSTLSAQAYQTSANAKLFENQKAIQAIGNTNNVAEIALRDKLIKENNVLAAGVDAAQRAVDFENVLKRDGIKTASQITVMKAGTEQEKALATHRGAIQTEAANALAIRSSAERVLDRLQQDKVQFSTQAFQQFMQEELQDFQGDQKDIDREIAKVNSAFQQYMSNRSADQVDVQLDQSERKIVLDELYKKGMLGIEEAAANAISVGSKSKTATLTYITDPKRLERYKKGILPKSGDTKALFEQRLLDYATSKDVWDAEQGVWIDGGVQLTDDIENAIKQVNPELYERITGSVVPAKITGDGDTTEVDGKPLTLGSATVEIMNRDGTVNLDSAAWNSTRPNRYDPTLDYKQMIGASRIYPGFKKAWASATAQFSGTGDVDRASIDYAKAGASLETFANDLVTFSTNMIDGRVIKSITDLIAAEVGNIRPGGFINRSDLDAAATLSALRDGFAQSISMEAKLLPEYGGSSVGSTQKQVTGARKNVEDMKVLLNEVLAFQKGFQYDQVNLTGVDEGEDQSTSTAKSEIQLMVEQNKKKLKGE